MSKFRVSPVDIRSRESRLPASLPLRKGIVVHSLARWLGQARIAFVRRRGAHLSPILRQLSDTIRSVTTASRAQTLR